MNKILEWIVGFLALIGLGTLVLKKKTGNPEVENKKVDEVKKEIAEEVNAKDIDSVVDDYNKRHGKG